jgi:hypothetical protein
MPLPRSQAEIFGQALDVAKNEIRKCATATVTAVYPSRQTVDVQLCVNNPVFDELGNTFTEPAPSLSDVPLGVLRGGSFFVWMPVAVGDSVIILFSDLSTDVWRAGDGTAQDPGWVGKHTMDSPFAIPMCAPDAKFFADPANAPTKLIIGKDGSPAQIRLSATDIELGNAVTDAVALAAKIDNINNALNDVVGALATFAAAATVAFAAVPSPSVVNSATLIANITALANALDAASPTVGSSLIKGQ